MRNNVTLKKPARRRDAETKPPKPRPHISASSLPFEVWTGIVSHLDVNDDLPSILALLRVSETLWEVTARHFYRRLSLFRSQLVRLIVAGGTEMSPRTRRAIAFVERLDLVGPIYTTDCYLLWDSAIPGEVLFPRVRQFSLRLYSTPDGRHDPERGWMQGLDPGPPKGRPRKDVWVFDRVDMCTWEWAHKASFWLPAKNVRTVVVHDYLSSQILMRKIRPHVDRFIIYDPSAQHFGTHAARSLPKWEANLSRHHAPVEIHFRDHDRHDSDDVDADAEAFMVPILEKVGWEQKPDSRIQFFYHHDPQHCETRCPVCGMSANLLIPLTPADGTWDEEKYKA